METPAERNTGKEMEAATKSDSLHHVLSNILPGRPVHVFFRDADTISNRGGKGQTEASSSTGIRSRNAPPVLRFGRGLEIMPAADCSPGFSRISAKRFSHPWRCPSIGFNCLFGKTVCTIFPIGNPYPFSRVIRIFVQSAE